MKVGKTDTVDVWTCDALFKLRLAVCSYIVVSGLRLRNLWFKFSMSRLAGEVEGRIKKQSRVIVPYFCR